MKKPPKILNQIVDKVLAFKPKAKTDQAKKRAVKSKRIQGQTK